MNYEFFLPSFGVSKKYNYAKEKQFLGLGIYPHIANISFDKETKFNKKNI